jgi:ubiquinone/menaquinone biosynthesis C-methylase UbiE
MNLLTVLKYFDLANNYRKYQIDLIKPYMKGEILEVGPGNGQVINSFIDNKNITLIEPEKYFFNILKKKFIKKKIKILKCKINSLNKKFDTILYSDVLEHITEDITELNKAKKLLKKNGRLIIIVPAFQKLYSSFDNKVRHVKRYEKKDFFEFSQKYKINIVLIKYFDCLGYIILIISKFFNFNNKTTVLGIKIWNSLIPLSKFLDKIFYKSNIIGKSLICVYKK